MAEKADHDLIMRAQGGDEESFALLLERHYDFMFRVAWQWCGIQEDAEDIAQEAAIKLASHIGDFHFGSAFMTWLYTIVLNTARDYHRDKSRKRLREQPLFADAEYVSPEASPEDKAMTQDVLRAIAALPETLREATLLVCWQQMSHKEAGALLQCPEGTISWRVHEARRLITETLGMEQKGKHRG